ncbi:methyltransferase family protein [Enterovibrio coralii]|uniref:Protein-S-isoprenylcysteine methyltransferase n=1 Tax=Enterovibrio coralii TaxID=294935 RepID=A0A135I8B5_9GAMM|nr:isoprenylcysteine carboxylmethyltransferase family protein [Enterovibrio coralii]KXF81692.1 protein-S-isoprenylcysteine methyltransferase [Enterovibrio coralii]
MKTLELKVPPVALVFLFMILMWWLSSHLPVLGFGADFRMSMFIVLTVISAGVCFAGLSAFRAQKTTVNPIKPETSSSLVQSGIYRFTRNPMYLGMALFLVGFGVYLDSVFAVLSVLLFVAYMTRFQIQPEESALKKNFGRSFEEYMNTTRRWL